MKTYLLFLALAAIAISGCTLTPDGIAKSSPLVKQFLSEHPNAELRLVYYSEADSFSVLEEISKDCNNQNMPAGDYYKLTITDRESGFNAVAWIDWDAQVVRCAKTIPTLAPAASAKIERFWSDKSAYNPGEAAVFRVQVVGSDGEPVKPSEIKQIRVTGLPGSASREPMVFSESQGIYQAVSAPLSDTESMAMAGTHTVHAVLEDMNGATTSSSINLTVNAPSRSIRFAHFSSASAAYEPGDEMVLAAKITNADGSAATVADGNRAYYMLLSAPQQQEIAGEMRQIAFDEQTGLYKVNERISMDATPGIYEFYARAVDRAGRSTMSQKISVQIGATSACTDSDRGADIYVKGTTIGDSPATKNVVWSDFCGQPSAWITDPSRLGEHYCHNGLVNGNDTSGRPLVVQCPHGCKDGACVMPPILEPLVCTDTDGGHDLFTMGSATGVNGACSDSCITQIGGASWVRECYCNGTTAAANATPCPAGYSCRDSRCKDGSIMDLSDYPVMFTSSQQTPYYIVIGRQAPQADSMARTNIALGIQEYTNTQIRQSSFMYDTQIANPPPYSVISIGSPCVNRVTANLLGNPADCDAGIEPGKAYLKLMKTDHAYYLLVYGGTDNDTLAVSRRLQDLWSYELHGMEMVIDTQPANTCSDSDGLDIYTSGSISGSWNNVAYTQQDICINSAMVLEHSCEGTLNKSTLRECGAGCSNGHCLLPETTCSDSDGGKDAYTKGTATWHGPNGYSTQHDTCKDSNNLLEYWCNTTSMLLQNQTLPCANGCVDGACKTTVMPDSCADSETGKDTTVEGHVYGYKGNANFDLYDKCIDSKQLREYYCDGTSSFTEDITCAESCSGGKCVPSASRCSDTDSGKDTTRKGTVSGYVPNSYYSHDDLCWNSSHVEEYFCDTRNLSSYQRLGCAYGCLDGACKAATMADSCTDEDSGMDTSKATKIFGYKDNINYKYFDYCVDSQMLYEYYCSGSTAQSTTILCENKCSNGMCVPSANTCTDTDGGKDTFTIGTVNGYLTNSQYSYSDACKNATAVQEYFCDTARNLSSYQYLTCANGCADGACKAATMADSCADEDSGMDTSKATKIFGYKDNINYKYFDYCVDGQMLYEYYCSGSTAQSTTILCEDKCSNGMCVPSGNTCTDTDGGQVYHSFGSTSGYLGGIYYTNKDGCKNSSTLQEYFCDTVRNLSGYKYHTCDAGICAEGMCIGPPETMPDSCWDNDSGQNFGVFGKVQGYLNDDSYAWADYCVDSTLVEYYCLGSQMNSVTYACPGKCTLGKCMPADNTCSDSDAGQDYSKAGIVTASGSTYTDYCVSTASLMEYYCLNNAMYNAPYTCPQGQVCSNGACGCANECTQGQHICAGQQTWDGGTEYYEQACGNYDSDTCLEWSSRSLCGIGQVCDSGYCKNSQSGWGGAS